MEFSRFIELAEFPSSPSREVADQIKAGGDWRSRRNRRSLAGAAKMLPVIAVIGACVAGAAFSNGALAQKGGLAPSSAAQIVESKSEVESLLNPFGDPWALRTDNPDIPIITSFSCFRKLPEQFIRPAPEQERFADKFSSSIVFGECSSVMDDPDMAAPKGRPNELKRLVADIKSHNPKMRYVGYLPIAEFGSGVPGFRELQKLHQNWFVHQNAGGELLRSKKGTPLLDITNPEYQDFIAGKISHSLSTYGMDGFLADGVRASLTRHADPRLIPADIENGWASGWRSILAKVKAAVGPDRLVFANVPRNEIGLIDSLLDVIDGVMLEDPFGAARTDLENTGVRAQFERVYAVAAAKNKYVITVVNTNANRTNFSTTSAEQEHRFARYYLAAYLIFRMHDKNLLQYYTPSVIAPQFNSQPFFTDWNLRVGVPSGRYQTPARGVYQRDFSNAIIYLNNSSQAFDVTFGECCAKFTPEGERVSQYSIPAKSGMIFMNAQTRQTK